MEKVTRTDEEWRNIISQVNGLIAHGESKTEALKIVGITPGSYYVGMGRLGLTKATKNKAIKKPNGFIKFEAQPDVISVSYKGAVITCSSEASLKTVLKVINEGI